MAVAGQFMRERPHIAGALDVVLTAQRVNSDALATDIAGGHRQVGHRHHHGGALTVLGDSQAIVDCRIRTHSVNPCRGTNFGCGHATELLGGLGAVLRPANELLPFPIQLGVTALRDELRVDKTLVDDRVRHRVNHGHIGAGQQLQVMVSLDMR